ncbi:MAG: Gfo/Idh/MocA family oxidoreductase, partial [Oscillospiraceae bacterium]|nr:Gfo/Idh/MocA family oxidoreductase [Oscillospiraceae bacterium]
MVAFCDIVKERAEEAAAKYGAAGSKVYSDYKELIKDGSIDIVHVCTPNSSHSVISVASLKAGKHVMCEKPMAKTAKEAQAMVDAAKQTGKKLTIGYQGRYRPDAQYLKNLCTKGALGEIYFAKAHAVRRRAVPTWGVFLDEELQGGGPLIDIGTHALDLTLWMLDNYKPAYVVGKAYHMLGGKADSANAWGAWDPKKFTVEDSAFGFVVMQNGATIFLESSWALNSLDVQEATCTLCGSEAGADMRDGLRINGEEYSRMYVKKPDLSSGWVAFYEGKSDDPSVIEAAQWIDAIRNGTNPTVLPEQAFVVTQILEGIYISDKTKKPYFF